MSKNPVKELTRWLEYASTHRDSGLGVDLHLWYWEVDALLAQLQELAK